MRIPGFRWIVIVISILVFTIPCAAKEAVVTHHATLRSDPSSQHRPILILQAGEDVDMLEAQPTNKYYHVRTADGTEGWIYSRNLEIVSPTEAPNGGGASSPSKVPNGSQPGVATSLSPAWDKPTPSPTTFEGPDGQCGPTGDGGDSFTNLR